MVNFKNNDSYSKYELILLTPSYILLRQTW